MSDATSEAKRYNAGKPKLSYFARSFHKALEAIARVKEFGAVKYSEGNWKMGNKPDSEYLDSMTRHLDAFQQGETYDRDSGCHHLGHAIWNLCALFELNHTTEDVINEPLFKSQVKHWAAKKEADKLNPTDKLKPAEKCLRRNCQPKPGDIATNPYYPEGFNEPPAFLDVPVTYKYTTGIGTPISAEEAVRRSNQGLSIKVVPTKIVSDCNFSSIHPKLEVSDE